VSLREGKRATLCCLKEKKVGNGEKKIFGESKKGCGVCGKRKKVDTAIILTQVLRGRIIKEVVHFFNQMGKETLFRKSHVGKKRGKVVVLNRDPGESLAKEEKLNKRSRETLIALTFI